MVFTALPPESQSQSPSSRVLVADPDRQLLAVYREGLAREGFEVWTAQSGLECLAALRRRPAVLVLDPSLPWGGGEGVLALMEERDLPRVPVILLAGLYDRDLFYRLARFPLDGYYVKPLTTRQLAQRIRAVLENQEDAHVVERRTA